MKINTKTIVIALVVALAAFLVWWMLKKKKDGAYTAGSSDPATGTVDYIIANIPFTNAEIRKIRAVQSTVNASTTSLENVRSKAARNGRTLDEQIVLDAIWLLYHPKDAWIAGPDGKTSYGWNLQQKVLNLN